MLFGDSIDNRPFSSIESPDILVSIDTKPLETEVTFYCFVKERVPRSGRT